MNISADADSNADQLVDDIEAVKSADITDIKDETIGYEQQPVVVHELKTIETITNLTQCPKCQKMITNKTLKYSHAKTCGIVKQPVKTPVETPVEISVGGLAPPTKDAHARLCPVKTPTIKLLPDAGIFLKTIHKVPKPMSLSPKPTTLEEMRYNYYINAKQQRTQKINKLFANAI